MKIAFDDNTKINRFWEINLKFVADHYATLARELYYRFDVDDFEEEFNRMPEGSNLHVVIPYSRSAEEIVLIKAMKTIIKKRWLDKPSVCRFAQWLTCEPVEYWKSSPPVFSLNRCSAQESHLRFVAHMGTSKIMSKAFQEIAPVLVPFLSDACEMNLLLAFKDLPEICNVFFLRPSSMSQSRTR